jgi:hypothetical protein
MKKILLPVGGKLGSQAKEVERKLLIAYQIIHFEFSTM